MFIIDVHCVYYDVQLHSLHYFLTVVVPFTWKQFAGRLEDLVMGIAKWLGIMVHNKN